MAGENKVLVEFEGKNDGLKKSSQDAKKDIDGVKKSSDETDLSLQKTGDSGSIAGDKLGKAFKVGAAAVAGAAVAASAMIGKLTTDSIKAFADYEQLSGGVDKLFGAAADTIKTYADTAYKTAGLSANAYMETVTGFSASLISGLKGDTVQAAEFANKAVSDMSDNANTYGTDMESIQRTYAGFAKGQFGMLDNLKLGYGGSQSEMARLINDSGVLGDTMVTAANVSEVSMDKIIEAVHQTQVNMNIAGTTAKEAATTISGSLASTKAAWTNVLASFASGDDDVINKAINGLLESAGNFVSNISAILPDVLKGVVKLIQTLIPKIPPLFADLLPAFIEGVVSVVTGLVDAIPGLLTTLTAIIPKFVAGFVKIFLSLVDALPQIIDGVLALFSAIAVAILEPKTIKKVIQALAKAVIGIIQSIAKFLKDPTALTAILEGAVTLFMEIVKALPDIIIALVKALPDIIKGLVAFLSDGKNVQLIIQAMVMLFIGVVPMVIAMLLKQLLDMFPQIGEFFKGFADKAVAWFKAIPKAFMKVMTAIKDFAVAIWDWIWVNVIKRVIDLVIGYFNMIVTVWNAIWNAVKLVVTTVWNAIWNAIKFVIDLVIAYIKMIVTVWTTILTAIKDAATTAWNWVYNKIIKPVIDFIVAYIQTIVAIVQAVWDGIRTAATTVWNAIKSVITGAIDGVKTVFTKIVDWFKEKFDKISSFAASLKDTITGIFSGIWDGLKTGFKTVVNWVIKGINTLIKGANKAIKWIPGVDEIPTIPELAQGGYINYAVGGKVQGRGTGTSDSIPAMLSNGEYVLRASAVKNLGVDNLNIMNEGKTPQTSSPIVGQMIVNEQADALAIAQQLGALVRFA